MGRIDELVSAEFAAWEERGRGWKVWPAPVRPEPAFREFTGYQIPEASLPVDDGRVPGFLASLFDSLEKKLNDKPAVAVEEMVEPEPAASEHPLTVEFVASLPATLKISEETLSAFLDSLHGCEEPVGFEIVGRHESVTIQFVSSAHDAAEVQRQLTAFFPKLSFTPAEGGLTEAWNENEGAGFIADFGLAHEFMLPIQTRHAVDPFVGLVAVLNELSQGEVALFQVLFQPVEHPWPGSIWRSVTDERGKALFANKVPLIPGTKAKLESPLFGVVVRAAAKAENFERSTVILRDMASSLRCFTKTEGNGLIPLTNDEYPFEAHEEDLLARQSRRSGMLLNRDELAGFVHLPDDDVRASKLCRARTQTKAAPKTSSSGILLGNNPHAGRTTPVHLSADERVKHMHVIGASGTGKSTLLLNLIRQDIENGEGVAVLDPHGDLIDRILGCIPPERVNDVVLIDPSDEQFFVGFNILSAHSDLEKTLLASDLVSVFQRLSTSWGDQMGSVLQNAILAFLESSEGGTLADLRRFLIEPAFREKFLQTVRDPDIVYYWRKAFTQLSGNKSIGPVLTRLETFLSPKPIRYMVSQQVNRLDFADILDSGKIFLAKLPQGQMGKENAFLLGSLLVSKFQQIVMSRQAQAVASRKDFWLYIDEFHNFITPSMAEILSGARKYRLGLILAHQELRQLERDREVASAVLSNPYTRVVFRVGDADARALENGFSSFEARDLQNLETGQAVCRIEKSDQDFNLAVPNAEDQQQAKATRLAVIAASRARYATPRAEVEAALFAKLNMEPPAAPVPRPKPAEIPKPTDSGKEAVVVSAPVSPTPEIAEVVAPPPRPVLDERGIGGHQHNLIRERIEAVARSLGFYPAREKLLSNGQKIDLALERPGQTIACEISLMTTVDHEVGNVSKCVKAGYQHVAVICTSEARLTKIEQAVSGCLPAESLPLVGYYLPEQFIQYLQTLKPQDPSPREDVQLGKYRVKRSASKLTTEEAKAQEAAGLKMLAETMRRKV